MGHTAEQAASLWNTRVSPPLVDNVADVSEEAGKCEVLDQQAVSDALATYNESYGNGVDKGQCIRRAIRKYLDTLGLDAEGRPYALKQRLGGKSEVVTVASPNCGLSISFQDSDDAGSK